jgi:CheY-like chemotaxis protein
MQRTVLIVEDFEDARSFMKFLIESYGYRVIEVGNGLEAVESFRHNRPDLILIDISMPKMDGLAATREIRKIEKTDNIPIIAVTAHGNFFYKQALEAGCNELINKPVSTENLEPLLSRYLS